MQKSARFVLISLLLVLFLVSKVQGMNDDDDGSVLTAAEPTVHADLRETWEVAKAWHEYNQSWARYARTGVWTLYSAEQPDSEEERLNCFITKTCAVKNRNLQQQARQLLPLKEMCRNCQNDSDFSEDFLRALNAPKARENAETLYVFCVLRIARVRCVSVGINNNDLELDWLVLLQKSLEHLACQTVIIFGNEISLTRQTMGMVVEDQSLARFGCPSDTLQEGRWLRKHQEWMGKFLREQASHDQTCAHTQYFGRAAASLSNRFSEVQQLQTKLTLLLKVLLARYNVLREPSNFFDLYNADFPRIFQQIGALSEYYQRLRLPQIPKSDFCCAKQAETVRTRAQQEQQELRKRLFPQQQQQREEIQIRGKEKAASQMRIAQVEREQHQGHSVTKAELDATVPETAITTAAAARALTLEQKHQSIALDDLHSDVAAAARATDSVQVLAHELVATILDTQRPFVMTTRAAAAAAAQARPPQSEPSKSIEMVMGTGIPSYEKFMLQLHRDFGARLTILRAGTPTLVRIAIPGGLSAMVAFDPPHGPALEKPWAQWRCSFKDLFWKLGARKNGDGEWGVFAE